MSVSEKLSDRIFHITVVALLTITSLAFVYPILVLVSSSFSDAYAIMSGRVFFLPVNPTLAAYKLVFNHPEIWGAYGNTIKYTLIGTSINILMTVLGAYPLSRNDLYGKRILMGFVTFTMFFSGGLIPSFLLIRDLGLLDSMWAILLPTSVSVWNLVIMRTFFQNNIPNELWESAALDGANDMSFLFRIVLPLSGPILAVMVLFYGVGHWNSWFTSMLYFNTRAKYPLQMILREIIIQSSTQDLSGASVSDTEMIGEGVKYATMMVATVPIMCLFPFLQRYFVKGVMIGALKG